MGWILLVDDDAAIRGTVAELLRDEGYSVIEAEDGQHALHLLVTTRERPSVVFLDLMMPGMRGEALLEVLGDLGLARELDIVVVTASLKQHVHGARRVLHKPFALADLLDVVEEYCEPPTQREPLTQPPPS